MIDVTVVIPVAPAHRALLLRAKASVEAQSYPAHIVTVYDDDMMGAGWARNRGLAEVETEFVVFLDADDELLPGFLAQTRLAHDVHAATSGRRYIYTDWYRGVHIQAAPGCAWTNHTWHCVTTLLPTAWAREVGGFDETLPGVEDTDFYMKLVTGGHCGARLAEPLFRYRAGGQRSKAFNERPDNDAIFQSVVDRYRGKTMSCCGNPVSIVQQPTGDQQPGDVLAVALWAGNRVETGRVTGRRYPRTGNGNLLYMAPADIDAAPHLFARVTQPATQDDQDAADFRAIAKEVLGGGRKPVEYIQDPSLSFDEPRKPDVATLMELYKKAAGGAR